MLYLLAKQLQAMANFCIKQDIQVPFVTGMKMSLNPLDIVLPLSSDCHTHCSCLWTKSFSGNCGGILYFPTWLLLPWCHLTVVNHLTIGLGYRPILVSILQLWVSQCHAHNLLTVLSCPVLFYIILTISFRNFLWCMFHQENPFLFFNANKDFFFIYHSVISKDLK